MEKKKWADPTIINLDFIGAQGVKGAVGTPETQGATTFEKGSNMKIDAKMSNMINATTCAVVKFESYTCIVKGFKQAGTASAHRGLPRDPSNRNTNIIHFKGISSAQAPS